MTDTWVRLMAVQDVRIDAAQKLLQQARDARNKAQAACDRIDQQLVLLASNRRQHQDDYLARRNRWIRDGIRYHEQRNYFDRQEKELRQQLGDARQVCKAAEQGCQDALLHLNKLRARREVLELQGQLAVQDTRRRRQRRQDNALEEQRGRSPVAGTQGG